MLDLDAYRLERAGVPIALEPKAFSVLALMVQRPGHLFTKQEIFDRVWTGTAVTDHALTRVIAQIRRALGDEAREARYLETVPTRGYRWIQPVEAVDLTPPALVPSSVPVPTRRVSLVSAIALAAMVLMALVLVRRGDVFGREAMPSAGGHTVDWPVQVTTHAGLDFHPALSPHEDAIAFASDRTGSFEIFVRALDGSAIERAITSDGSQNVQPAWSPDGEFIAYHSQRIGGIWIVPARGGTPKQVVAEGSKPSWSPDGTNIAYQSDEHADVAPFGFAAQSGSTIRMTSVDGGAVSQLTRSGTPSGGHAAPSWSPDGRFVTFAVFDSGSSNGLWLFDRRMGTTQAIYQHDEVYETVFAPDGSSIYIAGGDALITRLPFDPVAGKVTGAAEIIPVPGVPGVRGVSITRDGARLAFAGLGLNSQIWSQSITADGSPRGAARALTSDTSRRNSLPVIAPDGTRIAYMSSRTGERPNLWMMDVEGDNPMQLTSDHTFESQPEWSSDGRRITYLAKGVPHERLLSIDVATRKTDALINLGALRPASVSPIRAPLAEARLSRSTKHIVFSLREPPSGRRVLYVTEMTPLAPRRLTESSMSVGYPSWSPDERRVAVEIKDGSSTQAGVIDLETGMLTRLTNERGQTWIRSWSPNGRSVAAAALREGQWSLRAFDVDGGRERVITPPGPPRIFVRYPDWSARGDRIVYERSEMTGNIWLLPLRARDEAVTTNLVPR